MQVLVFLVLRGFNYFQVYSSIEFMVQQESFNCVKGSLMEEKLSFKIETHQLKTKEKLMQVSLGMGAQFEGMQNSFVFQVGKGALFKLECAREMYNITWRCIMIQVHNIKFIQRCII